MTPMPTRMSRSTWSDESAHHARAGRSVYQLPRRFEDANVLAVDRRRPDLPRVTLARGQEELPARQHTSARGMANRRLEDNTSWMDATDGCKPSSMKVRSTSCSESFPSTK